jgi:hypothetical protein
VETVGLVQDSVFFNADKISTEVMRDGAFTVLTLELLAVWMRMRR